MAKAQRIYIIRFFSGGTCKVRVGMDWMGKDYVIKTLICSSLYNRFSYVAIVSMCCMLIVYSELSFPIRSTDSLNWPLLITTPNWTFYKHIIITFLYLCQMEGVCPQKVIMYQYIYFTFKVMQYFAKTLSVINSSNIIYYIFKNLNINIPLDDFKF